jgi:hypothetical protein
MCLPKTSTAKVVKPSLLLLLKIHNSLTDSCNLTYHRAYLQISYMGITVGRHD